MYCKSFILAATLVLCSIGNVIAAEISTASEIEGEQWLSKVGNISINDGSELPATENPTSVIAISSEVKVQDNLLISEVSDRSDAESLILPTDVERALLSRVEIELPPLESTAKLRENTVVNGKAVHDDLAAVNNNAEFVSPTAPLADLSPMKSLGYYTPRNNLLMDDKRVAQSPGSTPPTKLEQPIGVPAEKRNYVGLMIGSVFNIPIYGINAEVLNH